MKNLSTDEATDLIRYYTDNTINEGFSDDGKIWTAIIKNDADLSKALKGAQIAWYDSGEYQTHFTGKVISEDGSKTASFEYDPESGFDYNGFSVN